MDFNNYDDDSEEELYPHQSKTQKIVKYTFRYTLYAISFLIWIILLFSVFSSCDPGMFNNMFFSDQAREIAEKEQNSFDVYNIQPAVDMNYLGTVQLKSIYYAADADELEIGIQFNLEKVAGGKLDNSLVFVLTDDNDNYYKAVYMVTDSNRKYGYARVSFAGVVLDLENNKYFDYTTSYDYNSEYNAMFTSGDSEESKSAEDEYVGVTYKLSIYSYNKIMEKGYATVENGIANIDYKKFINDPVTEIDVFNIYNNNTVITTEDYKYKK